MFQFKTKEEGLSGRAEVGWNWDGDLNPNPFTQSVGGIFHL
ncbi:MAG: hypothetical protein AAF915_29520 [Cyanobacteria bacterium P01_D01_bin.50]